MFHSISWQSYWLTMALLSAGYYLAVYLLYYRSDFKIRVPHRSTRDAAPFSGLVTRPGEPTDSHVQASHFDQHHHTGLPLPEADHPEAVVQQCMDELTAFFEEARRRKWVKEELLLALHGLLQKYPSLQSSSYKESLSRVIVSQCEHHCSIHFSAAEVARVW